MTSNGEAMAALGTTGTDNRATATGLHANTKAVRALATND